MTRWFDYLLKGEQNGVDTEAPVKIFVMGANKWRDEKEWPLARAKATPYYLHSKWVREHAVWWRNPEHDTTDERAGGSLSL